MLPTFEQFLVLVHAFSWGKFDVLLRSDNGNDSQVGGSSDVCWECEIRAQKERQACN
jgi:hypothetical protein